MNKIVIGWCGKKGSGKGTGTAMLKEIIYDTEIRPSMTTHSTSGILTDLCNAVGLLPSRPTLQLLPEILKKEFPGWTLAEKIRRKVEEDESQISQIDSLRLPEDLLMIKSFSYFLIVYIEADDKIRFERLKRRNEKPGESKLTWEQFLKEENASTETAIEEIAKSRDFRITNSGTPENLKLQIQEFVTEKFFPMWREMRTPS